jgi:hypothetical protein
MNAQILSATGTPILVSHKINKRATDWLLRPGFLMSGLGIILIALGNWVLLNSILQILFIVSGWLLAFCGIVLIPSWLIYQIKTVASGAVDEENESI